MAFDAGGLAWSQGAGTAGIEGQAFVQTRGGQPRTCAGMPVNLVPSSPYSDARMRVIYGATDRGFTPAYGSRDVRFSGDTGELERYVRTAVCDAQGNFAFRNIPGGTYYLVSTIVWQSPGSYIIDQGGRMMRRVDVRDGESVREILTP